MDQGPEHDLRIDHPPTTLRELAVERLRDSIITGRFHGGDRLVERTLCDQLGVSRSVVREAIRYLEAEGLVEIPARSGPVVATLDWPRARQIYDIRRLLEAKAAADCARIADADVKDPLAAPLDVARARRYRATLWVRQGRTDPALADLEAAFSDADARQLYAATTAFYRTIFIAAGHEIAWEIVQRLNSRISRLRALTLATTDRNTSGPAHMANICAAIAANDAKAAAEAVRAHLHDAAEIARRLLEPET